MAAAATVHACVCRSMSCRSSPTNSTSTSPSTTCHRTQQVEQDRAPPLLVHQPKLARSTARQLSYHRRPDLGDDHKDRPHRALRDRRDPLPEGHHCLRRRDGGHQHHPTRFPRRMELHYRAKLKLKPSVRLRTGPKVRCGLPNFACRIAALGARGPRERRVLPGAEPPVSSVLSQTASARMSVGRPRSWRRTASSGPFDADQCATPLASHKEQSISMTVRNGQREAQRMSYLMKV